MPRDSQTKMSKKESKVSKKREQQIRKKKQNESSDDDASFYTDDDSENEMDDQEYRKFLKKMFPSKHLDKKIKAGERLKEILDYDGPILVDIKVVPDENCYPMVAPGKSNAQMIGV